MEITVASPGVLEVDNKEYFATWESTNEYLHGRYGFGAAILESEPSRADVIGLKEFYRINLWLTPLGISILSYNSPLNQFISCINNQNSMTVTCF